jgi:hypothetical protein
MYSNVRKFLGSRKLIYIEERDKKDYYKNKIFFLIVYMYKVFLIIARLKITSGNLNISAHPKVNVTLDNLAISEHFKGESLRNSTGLSCK